MKTHCKRGHLRAPENLDIRGACRACIKILSGIYAKSEKRKQYQKKYLARPDIQILGKIWARKARLKYLYGLTENQYNDFLSLQNYKCAICSVPQNETKKFVVDHDHKTGEVRGLLCYTCNIKLVSTFETYSTLIPLVLKYLKKEVIC